MLNLKKIIRNNTHFKNLIYKQFWKASRARVNLTGTKHYLSTTSQYQRSLWIEPNFNPDISSSQAFRRCVHSSAVSFQEIRYKDYLKRVKEGMQIVDVRNPGEIKNMGRVNGSFEIPLDQLEQEFMLSPEEWKKKYNRGKPSEDTPIMLICAGGVRSKTGAKMLQQMGYRQPLSYRGGYKMFKDKK